MPYGASLPAEGVAQPRPGMTARVARLVQPAVGDTRAWDPTTSTLIFGARDAVLVDPLMTVPDARAAATTRTVAHMQQPGGAAPGSPGHRP
jgi:hypothetical protein